GEPLGELVKTCTSWRGLLHRRRRGEGGRPPGRRRPAIGSLGRQAAGVRMERDPEQRKPTASRSYGLGMELAGAVVGFTLLGYWIDRHYGRGARRLLLSR